MRRRGKKRSKAKASTVSQRLWGPCTRGSYEGGGKGNLPAVVGARRQEGRGDSNKQ